MRMRMLLARILVVAFLGLALVGCDDKQTILDIETPEGELEIEQDPETGEVEIDVDDKK